MTLDSGSGSLLYIQFRPPREVGIIIPFRRGESRKRVTLQIPVLRINRPFWPKSRVHSIKLRLLYISKLLIKTDCPETEFKNILKAHGEAWDKMSPRSRVRAEDKQAGGSEDKLLPA